MSAETTRHPSLDELSAWVDGEIAGAYERQMLAEHVAGCVSCGSLVEDFRALAGAQASAPVPPVPFPLQGRVLERLAAERFGGRRARRFVLPLSAAATLLIGLVAVWLYRQQAPPAQLAAAPPMETHQVAPAPEPQPPAPQAEAAAPPAAPVPVPALPPDPRRTKEKAKDEASPQPGFAPVPAQASQAQAPQGLEGAAESRASNAQAGTAHWVRLPVDSFRKEAKAEATAKVRRDTAAAAQAEAPQDLEAGAGGGACAVRDLLQPPLRWTGMDAERARTVADRARAAGATEVVLATAPVLRLTLVLPPAAWVPVQEALTASGIPVPDAVRVAPEGGGCLEVAVDREP